MKVAYFLTHPIQYQSPLIRRLIASGIDLHVYYASDSTSRSYYDPGYSREVKWDVPLLDGYEYTVLNAEPASGSRRAQIRSYSDQIDRALSERPADVWWLHGWHHPLVVAAWKLARQHGAAIMMRGETSMQSVRGGMMGRLLHRWYYTRAFRELSLCLATGTLNQRLYLRYGVKPQKVFLMPHAVDNEFFQQRVAEAKPQREALRERLGLESDSVVLLYCGRLSEEKDVTTLIAAMALLKVRGTKQTLLIVGDGPQMASLKAQAEAGATGQVHFLGFRNQTELPALYDLCDVLVLPSVFETWGLVVNEAMNAAKPVIVSDRVGAGADLVKEGVNGAVFRAGNSYDLAEKLVPWITDATRRSAGGTASLAIINKWSLREDTEVFHQALNSLSSQAKARERLRVAFVFTHEIQYFTNVLDELHSRGEVEVMALYANQTKTMLDTGFNRVIAWDNRPAPAFPSVVLAQDSTDSAGDIHGTLRWRVFKELSAFNPDVVHLNGYSAGIQWLAWAWAWLHGRPTLARGDGDTMGGANRTGGTLVGRALSRLFTSRVSHVFYQGEENRKFWLQRGAKPEVMSWIPCVPDNAVYRKPMFVSKEERQAFRAQAGVSEGDVVFLVSGKLDARKRPQDAVAVLAKADDARCKVWFLGSGPMEAELKASAENAGVADRINWWGFRNQTEIPRILQAADALLHPSQQDPWPYSVLEGAMCGLALVLSDQTGSYPDLVTKGGAGLIFECGNLESMAAAMKQMAEDDRRQSFREAALRVSEEYTEARGCEVIEAAALRIEKKGKADSL